MSKCTTIAKGKQPRSTFCDFGVHFRWALEAHTGASLCTATDEDLCRVYDGLRHAEKTVVLNDVARRMHIT